MRLHFLVFFFVAFLPLKIKAQEFDTLKPKEEIKSLYKLDLVRTVQGTMQLSREAAMKNNWTYQIGLMGTYASTRGLAKPYLEAQDFSYTDAQNFTYYLDNVEARGYGINLQFRKYLGKNAEEFKGFYASPELFFRQLSISSLIFDNSVNEQKEIKRNLYLGYAGYMLGFQKIILKVVSLDLYFGGGFFYSQYDDSSSPTRFRKSYQVDYTGFYLNSGVLIGVVK
ncbi:MAG: DUF3575 domain-containing protein [Bacteroidetes bacterium]|nr:DUF3575 domain-containing protein [Bacteroidota bacterium]HET6244235.1 hypothetical protein [Bacteroidia bacterium]